VKVGTVKVGTVKVSTVKVGIGMVITVDQVACHDQGSPSKTLDVACRTRALPPNKVPHA
jgi:hypothetical protein